MDTAFAMLIALGLDALIGWPGSVFRRIGHPVVWMGAVIGWSDRNLNRQTDPTWKQFSLGTVTLSLVVGLSVLPAVLIFWVLPSGIVGAVLTGILAWPFVAVHSMHEHVQAVFNPLNKNDLEGSRHAVSMIVGRDPKHLDQAGIARATIESLAENTSDGVVAPLFWGMILGLPGIVAYKAINTLDSMIGHRSDTYEFFGKASARVDDLVNLVPAPLTGLLFSMVSKRPGASLRLMVQDGRRHRSPNAGWPEAAMAGALNRRLSGPRTYGNRTLAEPWVNEGAPDPSADDVKHALLLYRRAMWFGAVILAAVAIL